MKNNIIIILCCIIHYNIQGQKVFSVSTAEEFIAAIQSDCEINITKSCIIISDLKPVATDYYEVIEDSAGKSHIIIKGISDLKISGENYNDSYIVSSTEYQPVLQFKECSDISIENVMFAHGPDKGIMCSGAALLFSQCESIFIDSCYLFGSGSFGLVTVKYPDQKFGIKKLTCANSIIGSCTNGIMNIADASDVIFKNCNFRDNNGGIYLENAENISFYECNFSFNKFILPYEGATKEKLDMNYLINLEKTKKINFYTCKISNNSFGFLVYNAKLAEGLLTSEFCNNNFKSGISFIAD
jgi:parallel beta-helix repeat protein